MNIDRLATVRIDYKPTPKILNERMATDISNKDFERFFGLDVGKNIMKYSEFQTITNIKEILPTDWSYKIILIEEEQHSGHWVLILRYGMIIEVFDSYGAKPSATLNFINLAKRVLLGQGHKYLNDLLMKAKAEGFTVIYNKKRFQKISPKINTCGRHISFRLFMALTYTATLVDYINIMNNLKEEHNLTPDQIVSILIN